MPLKVVGVQGPTCLGCVCNSIMTVSVHDKDSKASDVSKVFRGLLECCSFMTAPSSWLSFSHKAIKSEWDRALSLIDLVPSKTLERSGVQINTDLTAIGEFNI